MSYSLNNLYEVVGISKQAVYQYKKRNERFEQQVRILLLEVDELRAQHPGCGLEKMYWALQPDFLGRDRFVNLLSNLGYQIKKKRNYPRTTRSVKQYYTNQIRGLTLDAPHLVWQSDITYIPVGQQFFYAIFIIDVYSKLIVGFEVSDHMRASANVKALKKAIGVHGPPHYHHSDHGSQYGYKEYLKLLKVNNIQISRAESAPDNAYAERINRTIKEEYIDHWKPKDLKALRKMTIKAVNHYNKLRPHNRLKRKSPIQFILYWKALSKEQRPLETIFDNLFLTK